MIFSSIFRTISQKIYTNPIPLLLIFLKLYSHLQCDFIYIVFQRQWHPTPVLLPGKSHGWKSMVGYSPWGCKELDMTEQLHFYFTWTLRSLRCNFRGQEALIPLEQLGVFSNLLWTSVFSERVLFYLFLLQSHNS